MPVLRRAEGRLRPLLLVTTGGSTLEDQGEQTQLVHAVSGVFVLVEFASILTEPPLPRSLPRRSRLESGVPWDNLAWPGLPSRRVGPGCVDG